ncbi:hypothetical protein JB92DRAFT_2988748 [Gautieria morchelliformis]|nr:hypothetical protein JB92DRAFT_2988748 [Gautieria morchelliformis]
MTSSPIPRLRLLAGPSPSHLTDISALVNTAQPHTIQSDRFIGRVVVHIKGFPGADESEYFEREDRRGITWSIQVQGRFLQPHSADDVLFGNTFDRPLKLPWGSSAALTFMHFIDPTLEHDLPGPKPWALSPLITTMPHFVHQELSTQNAPLPPFPPPAPESIKDDTKLLCKRIGEVRFASDLAHGYVDGNGNGRGSEVPRLTKASKRRAYFANPKNRHEITFGPKDVLTTDFCYGFLSFPSLALNIPGGISFDLKKYWDGQPVRFVCVDRQRSGRDQDKGGDDEDEDDNMFWCVVVEAAED